MHTSVGNSISKRTCWIRSLASDFCRGVNLFRVSFNKRLSSAVFDSMRSASSTSLLLAFCFRFKGCSNVAGEEGLDEVAVSEMLTGHILADPAAVPAHNYILQ